MANKKRLNVQVKEELVLELKELSVKLTQKKKRMIPMQTLADRAISDFIKKTKKEVE